MSKKPRRLAPLLSLTLATLTLSFALGVASAQALTYAAYVSYATDVGAQSVAVGDFNGDGDADLVTANGRDGTTLVNTVSVLLGNGDGSFADKADYGTGDEPYSVTVGDFDGDGKQDLVTANHHADTVSVLLGKGDGTFRDKVDYATGDEPSWVAVGDFNGDGVQDLVTTNDAIRKASVLLGKGDGTFRDKVDYGIGDQPWSVAVGDFNGDGRQDLATANCGDDTVSVLLGNGDGTFRAEARYGTGDGPYSVAVSDLNGDGNEDLVTANGWDDTVSVLLGMGDGTFQTKVDYDTGKTPRSVAVGDFNGDGVQDLASADYSDKAVGVLLGSYNLKPSGTIRLNAGATVTASQTVSIDSAVAETTEMRVRDAGGIWSSWGTYARTSAWVLPARDGTKTVEVEYRNDAASTTLSGSILLDTTAPTTVDDAPSGWQRSSPLTVTLTADDGTGSGVAGTQYKLDGASGWSTGSSVVVGGDGTHTLIYRSTDVAGNVEATRSCSVSIDTTAPSSTQWGADASWHRSPVTVSFTASDTTSGVARSEYSIDGGVSWTAGGAVSVSAEGKTTVSYRSTDVAGNVEGSKTCEVRIDTQAPSTSAAKVRVHKGRKAVFKVTVHDPTPCSADGATVQIKIRNARGKVVKTLRFSNVATNTRVSLAWAKCRLAKGSYRYTVYATDAAGNVQKKAGHSRLVVR